MLPLVLMLSWLCLDCEFNVCFAFGLGADVDVGVHFAFGFGVNINSALNVNSI